jgi:hydroxyacylglutathione hydrolase
MKHLNNKGADLLSSQKEFKVLSAIEMAVLVAAENDLLVVDTRDDRNQVMAAHIKGSFYAPFGSLSTAMGSMVEDATRPIVLIIDEQRSAEARHRLINIGYDNVLGYMTPKSLGIYLEKFGKAERIPVTTFAAINDELPAGALKVVDVRSGNEYEAAHIEGAIFAPYTRLPEFLGDIPKTGKLYVHCGSGLRASVAVSYLKSQGYDVILVNDNFSNSYVAGATSCGTKSAPASVCSTAPAATGTCGG